MSCFKTYLLKLPILNADTKMRVIEPMKSRNMKLIALSLSCFPLEQEQFSTNLFSYFTHNPISNKKLVD
jgi:hypothetical protein